MIPFGAKVENHHISAKDLSRLHQFGKKVLPGIFLGYVIACGRNLERRHHWSQTFEELEKMDASGISSFDEGKGAEEGEEEK